LARRAGRWWPEGSRAGAAGSATGGGASISSRPPTCSPAPARALAAFRHPANSAGMAVRVCEEQIVPLKSGVFGGYPEYTYIEHGLR
jgi:hypothetical protein